MTYFDGPWPKEERAAVESVLEEVGGEWVFFASTGRSKHGTWWLCNAKLTGWTTPKLRSKSGAELASKLKQWHMRQLLDAEEASIMGAGGTQ